MEFEEFGVHAHAFSEWMADYLASVEKYPVRSQVQPGDVAAQISPAHLTATEAEQISILGVKS